MSDPAQEFDFTLVLSGISEVTDAVTDRLFEAGCDDGTLSVQSGRAYLSFTRVAEDFMGAVLSAIRDVESAGVGAQVVRLDSSDLVTQAEIARRSGKSRQMISYYVQGQRGPGQFPPPACHVNDEEGPLWSWTEVARWMHENGLLDANTARDAEQEAAINAALEWRHIQSHTPEIAREALLHLSAT